MFGYLSMIQVGLLRGITTGFGAMRDLDPYKPKQITV